MTERASNSPLPPSVPSPPPTRVSGLRAAAYILLIVACGWFLLGELQALFRPLLFAVLATYALMPLYARLRQHLPTSAALIALSAVVTALFAVLALSVTASLLTLSEDETNWRQRALGRVREVSDWAHSFSFVGPVPEGATPPEQEFATRFTDVMVGRLKAVAIGLPEVFAAGLYLLFLLAESARFPERVRHAYAGDPDRARQILQVFNEISTAVSNYLKAKVVSSLLLAVPVGIVLFAFGVPFAMLWAVLTFLCNFIPYLGTVISYSLPVLFAAVEFGFTGKLGVVAGLVFAVHLLGAAVVEPLLLGRAVGVSPLVILASLSVWGILWGIPGMLLAVPLTVVVKIVMEHIPATRPVAGLLGDGGSHGP